MLCIAQENDNGRTKLCLGSFTFLVSNRFLASKTRRKITPPDNDFTTIRTKAKRLNVWNIGTGFAVYGTIGTGYVERLERLFVHPERLSLELLNGFRLFTFNGA